MPEKTNTYKLDYFKQGSYYSSKSDRRRFLTMDYNMKSYVGLVGVGVIGGWTIDALSGLKVQILPGSGMIDGYYSESPYIIKQRSDMVDGDREVNTIPSSDGEPEDDLTTSQRAKYVSVIRLYDSSFTPVGSIENSFVKVVVPTEITLSDNSDTYIYARRPTGATPYPALEDYPSPAGTPPNRGDYDTYNDYQVVLDEYNAKLDAIRNYNWYTNPDNHFTAVEFYVSGRRIDNTSSAYLGRVVTRNKEVSKADTSGVQNLSNFYSEIKKVATELLVKHKHGGNQPFDPPKIRLETDIRSAFLRSYEDTGRATYDVVETVNTSIALGHKHTYQIDEDGNGQTISKTGSTDFHFHNITSGIVGIPEGTTTFVEDHIHTIDIADQEAYAWESDSPYIVYVNGERFADETSDNVSVNTSKKRITLENGVSAAYKKYSCEFTIDLAIAFRGGLPEINGVDFSERDEDSSTIAVTYRFEERTFSVLRFMLDMQIDYGNKLGIFYEYQEYYNEKGQLVTNSGIILNNFEKHPFLIESEGNKVYEAIDGFSALESQSTAAQTALIDEGDQFIFTPPAARNITIALEEIFEGGNVDSVKIEIFGNSEVTGILSPENIIFLNANKILSGEFIPEVIPFISHIGRLKEECFPPQYPLISNDAVRYQGVPAITDASMGHYHKLFIDKKWTGVTSHTMVGNEPVYYQEDDDGNTYFISHAHGIEEGSIKSSDSNGLTAWQNNVGSEILTSSDHSHNVIIPSIGNDKVIYAIKEDVNGNIYVGTSDGFIIIPYTNAYQFIMNGVELYFYGNDLWALIQSARLQYEAETGNPFFLTESVYYPQITTAEKMLVSDGDSVLLTNTVEPDREEDEVMIKKVSYFRMPNFKYTQEKNQFEVLSSEQIIDGPNDNGEVVVERNFNNVPIWSIDIKTSLSSGTTYVSSTANIDLLVVGSDLISRSIGIEKTPYQPWEAISLPFSVGVIRKAVKVSDGSYWAASNEGVLVSRNYANGNAFDTTNIPGGNPDIKDILEGERGTIYVASPYGIFTTVDGGKSWIKKFQVINGFKQIVRDFSLDKSTIVNGHYHNVEVDTDGNGFMAESTGSGQPHFHTMDSWNVSPTMGHTHTIVVTLYAIDNNEVIWISIDNGENWSKFGELQEGENGEIFPALGKVFVSQADGLYVTSNGTKWDLALSSKVYSYEWNYDMTAFFVGTDNTLYKTYDGATYQNVYSFDGYPSPILLDSGVRRHFGYAYSNRSRVFHFKDFNIPSSQLTALIYFSQWFAEEGNWDSQDLYDIYIDHKRILSTKFEEDKRSLRGYSFDIEPSNGLIDFSASSQLLKVTNIFDRDIEVASGDGFSVGDLISIGSEDSLTYDNILAINGNVLTLTTRITKAYEVGSKVVKIPTLNGDSSVIISIYNSLLSNIGKFTHYELEDGLSNYSDGRPYQFNDSYLSNLLQLTQAARYVYPNINSDFINDIFYDFRYSSSASDPIYPYIGDYIDLITSSIYNQQFYSSPFIRKKAKSINRVLIGYGYFKGTIIVATDIGIFWSKLVPSLEANWFYIDSVPYNINDIAIFGGTRLLAATDNGTYYTDDMITWVRESSVAMDYDSYAIGLRWNDSPVVVVPSHDAQFISKTDKGEIISQGGTPYKVLEINQGIRITDAGDKNGIYIIEDIKDGGTGYGSKIIVSPKFDGSDGVKYGIGITMGTWWGQWDGDTNTSNTNITNTLMVGGVNHISYNDGGSGRTWYQSETEATDFIARYFLSLSNGKALAAAQGNGLVSQRNYLFDSNDIGQNWSIFRSFDEARGEIMSSSITDFNNTSIKVKYTQPENYLYVFGILDQQEISIYKGDSNVALFSGRVVWNEMRDGFDKIVIYGNEAHSVVEDGENYTFRVLPFKVNTMAETKDETLFFGTDKGIYHDLNTVVENEKPKGTIVNAGINGLVKIVDISGTIISIGTSPVNGNSILSVSTSTPIRGNELAGKKLYITDTSPVEEFDIISSDSIKVGDESNLEIQVDTDGSLAGYTNKRFRVAGDNSRIYVNFDLPVTENQFNGGKLVITSTEKSNRGKFYNIVKNGTDYIDLDTTLVPSSTLVTRKSTELLTTTTTTEAGFISNVPLQVGQSIRLVDSTGYLTLWVSLDREVKENTLNNLTFNLITLDEGETSSESRFQIYSNLKNSITLITGNPDILLFDVGNKFAINGVMFEQLPGFSLLKTSKDSDHYHDVETVGGVVRGKIGSFGATDASFVTINVTDTANFNNPLVQLRGDLFEGAQIVFTTNNNVNMRYLSDVVSHTLTSITVRLKSSNYWNFSEADDVKISTGWNWAIDATNYGYTDGIVYDDFTVIYRGLIQDGDRGDNDIEIESTNGILIGDKVMIQDDTLSFETNEVSQIINSTTIRLVSELSRTFYLSRNPQIKVQRDVFANTHIHQVRANEFEPINIEAYLDNGYPSTHSHRVLPLVSDVSTLLNYDNSILSFGSSSIIYRTSDNGVTWQRVAQLNDFVEGGSEVDGISTATLNGDSIIAGATNGSLFTQSYKNGIVVKLQEPL